MAYLTVQGLMKPMKLDLIDRLIENANFEDGVSSATHAAKMVKRNLQIPKNSSHKNDSSVGFKNRTPQYFPYHISKKSKIILS